MSTQPVKVPRSVALLIAAQAGCDPRSVVKYVRGELTRDGLHARISYALVDTGHSVLVRSPPSPVARDYTPRSRA